MVSNNTQATMFILCVQSMYSGVQSVPKKYSRHHYTNQQQSELLISGRMDPCFHILYTKLLPYHRNVAAAIDARQTCQHFSSFRSSFLFWSACVNCRLNFFLFFIAPNVVWYPSFLRFHASCSEMFFHKSWLYEWLSELLQCSYQLKAV